MACPLVTLAKRPSSVPPPHTRPAWIHAPVDPANGRSSALLPLASWPGGACFFHRPLSLDHISFILLYSIYTYISQLYHQTVTMVYFKYSSYYCHLALSVYLLLVASLPSAQSAGNLLLETRLVQGAKLQLKPPPQLQPPPPPQLQQQLQQQLRPHLPKDGPGDDAATLPLEQRSGNLFLHTGTKLATNMAVQRVDNKVGTTLGAKLLPVAERGFTRLSTRLPAGSWSGKVAGQIAAKIASARTLAIAIPVVGAILLLIDIIWETLKAALRLDVSEFRECHAWERDMNGLPHWLQSIITGVPVLGTLFESIGNKLCFRIYGCEPGMELTHGLCYRPCPQGYFSDGATQCYRDYPEWQQNSGHRVHSLTAITKRLLPAPTPRPVTECAHEDQERLGGLCYPRCAKGYQARDTVCWKRCNDEEEWDEGGGLCRRKCADGYGEVAGVCYRACPEGYHDDGATCRLDAHIFGKGCCTVGGWWCRDKCPQGYAEDPCTCRRDAHIFGKHSYVPETRVRHSYVRKPTPLRCAGSASSSLSSSSSSNTTTTTLRELTRGLCYADCPPGYRQDTLGICAQICPPGSRDFGVGCSRERRDRGVGKVPFAIRVKDKL